MTPLLRFIVRVLGASAPHAQVVGDILIDVDGFLSRRYFAVAPVWRPRRGATVLAAARRG